MILKLAMASSQEFLFFLCFFLFSCLFFLFLLFYFFYFYFFFLFSSFFFSFFYSSFFAFFSYALQKNSNRKQDAWGILTFLQAAQASSFLIHLSFLKAVSQVTLCKLPVHCAALVELKEKKLFGIPSQVLPTQ